MLHNDSRTQKCRGFMMLPPAARVIVLLLCCWRQADRCAHLGMQLEEDFIRSNPEWVKELELMLQTKEKAEIQALSSFGFQYLSHTYLPSKLERGDWI
jgi:hypothetical protein